jgi:glycosyltransferase involved in cell wall biosynthesis
MQSPHRTYSTDDPVRAFETAPVLALYSNLRVRAEGKFLFVGAEQFDIKGVTYGPFRPTADGCEYHDPRTVNRDFHTMAEAGLNAVRVYTVPPTWLLDAAQAHGLRVMVGLPWEQHVAFLDDRKQTRRIIDSVRKGVRSCAGHPAVLCFAVGNEIPASIVRWHGPEAIERFLRRLFYAAKSEDPQTLVTYVSYPTTEYLRLPFLDFITFNVYLEDRQKNVDYIARLQNLAGELPLVMAEVGLDSIRNGDAQQAETLSWQIRTTFRGGCAGTFVFAWTDEWFRGGFEIEDWAFGLVTHDREPKPALRAVQGAFAEPLLPEGESWPRISIIVCSYNGEPTIRETFEGIARLAYENYEVVVVDDGSTDRTAEIASEFDCQLISVPNGGLSSARNIGLRAATGEIVAYIDDDAYPSPHWLSFLAIEFLTRDHVGIGGPNLAPPDDGFVADCVANSPGGPSHVLITDLLAEHLPGCNMAFRRDAVLAIEGFDTRFRIAGDDVDLCWRLLEQGETLGFHAGAVVWHHRRGSVRTYLRQQRNYGRAEAMLEQKWPERYNRFGHLRWSGTLYGKGHTRPLSLHRKRIHHGVWGSRLFQSVYGGQFDSLWSITLMPEWFLVTGVLTALTLLGFAWSPLLWLAPAVLVAIVVPLIQVWSSTRAAIYSMDISRRRVRWGLHALTGALHILQPLVRLAGRLEYRLSPWRSHGEHGNVVPRTLECQLWSEEWHSQVEWLTRIERSLKTRRVLVRSGGPYDRWDLQAACGLLGGTRLTTALEEHGAGRQLLRLRAKPRLSVVCLAFTPLLFVASVVAGMDHAWAPSAALGTIGVLCLWRAIRECSNALYTVQRTIAELESSDPVTECE